MKKVKLSKEEKDIETALLKGEFKPLKGKELEKIEIGRASCRERV